MEYKKAQLEKDAEKLEKVIKRLNNKLNYLEEELKHHPHLSLDRDIENPKKNIYMELKGANEELKRIRYEINDLGEEK